MLLRSTAVWTAASRAAPSGSAPSLAPLRSGLQLLEEELIGTLLLGKHHHGIGMALYAIPILLDERFKLALVLARWRNLLCPWLKRLLRSAGCLLHPFIP